MKTGTWIAVISAFAAILGLIPGYYIFWDKPDLVFEEQLVTIPLPESMGSNLPNVLVLLKIQNTGHRPSENIQGNFNFAGDLLHYEVRGPNPAYGRVSDSQAGSQINITCSRLAPGEFPVLISAWVKGKFKNPDSGLTDSLGAARKVRSIEEEEHKFRSYTFFLGGIISGIAMAILLASAVRTTIESFLEILSATRKLRDAELRLNKLRRLKNTEDSIE